MISDLFEQPKMRGRIESIVSNRAVVWCFDKNDKLLDNHRSIHIKALMKWYLTTFDYKGNEITMPMPDGEYTLHFPPGSINLSLLVIDPDPGNGDLGGERLN
jgi:hypothetical protein